MYFADALKKPFGASAIHDRSAPTTFHECPPEAILCTEMGQIGQIVQMPRICRRFSALALAVFLRWREKTAIGIGQPNGKLWMLQHAGGRPKGMDQRIQRPVSFPFQGPTG
jgi:hypothetical protein